MNPQHPHPHRHDGAEPFRRQDARRPDPNANPTGAGIGDSGELVPLVRVGGLADLIATVPYVLTYVPAEAVVVMAFAGRRLTVTACLPLPPAAQVAPAVRHLNRVLAQASRDPERPGTGGVTHALVVGYGTPAIDPILTEVAGELAVPVDDVVRVQGDRWWSLTFSSAFAVSPARGVPGIAVLVRGCVPGVSARSAGAVRCLGDGCVTREASVCCPVGRLESHEGGSWRGSGGLSCGGGRACRARPGLA